MRRKIKRKNKVEPDFKYNSVKVEKFINYIMERGKKNTARKIVYGVFDEIKKEAKKDPIEVFEEALKNTGPHMEVRSRRIGGANYQVPREVRPERKMALSMRWIVEAARGRKGMPMKKRLYEELLLASKGEGVAVKKKDDTHRMAEANRAFAHFSW
jgi:small subunit ribosomal protein S7